MFRWLNRPLGINLVLSFLLLLKKIKIYVYTTYVTKRTWYNLVQRERYRGSRAVANG